MEAGDDTLIHGRTSNALMRAGKCSWTTRKTYFRRPKCESATESVLVCAPRIEKSARDRFQVSYERVGTAVVWDRGIFLK